MQHDRNHSPPSADLRIHTSLRYDPALITVPTHNPNIAKCWNTGSPSPFLLLNLHRDRLLRAATYLNWPAAIQLLTGEAGLRLITTLPEHITAELQKDVISGKARRLRVSVGADGSVTHEIFDTPPRALESLFPDQLPPPGDNQARNVDDDNDDVDVVDDDDNQDEKQPMVIAPHTPSPPYTILIDNQPVQPSIYTHFKTTKRQVYDDARKRIIPTSPKELTEVLLIVTDTHNDEARTSSSSSSSNASILEGSFTTPYLWRNGRWVTPPVSRVPADGTGEWSGGHDGVSRRWALERGLAIEQVVPVSSIMDGEECWISNGAQGFLRGIVMLQ